MDELRRTGLDKMNEVYAWDMPDMPGEFFALTVDHLFGRIWTRPGLSMRDRRMARDRGADRSRPVGSARGPSQRRPA